MRQSPPELAGPIQESALPSLVSHSKVFSHGVSCYLPYCRDLEITSGLNFHDELPEVMSESRYGRTNHRSIRVHTASGTQESGWVVAEEKTPHFGP